jgi:mxaL protein
VSGRRRAPNRRVVQRGLLALACLSLVLALFGPSIKVRREVFDLLAVVDITQSMNVLDYRLNGLPTSRLTFAKHALHSALLELPCGSKLGLAIFTEYRTLVLFAPVEVCRNQAELVSAVDAINGQMAWANASQIAQGLYAGMQIAQELPDRPALVFITDGHEAPPLNPRYRPVLEGRPGEVRGIIVGAGGLTPLPIPKIDPDGTPQGFWRADEVLQTDLYTRGRSGSVAGEPMTESQARVSPLPQDQPGGREQLSALHERYLKLLASETGLGYRRLMQSADLTEALTHPSLARRETVSADVSWIGGTLALLSLLGIVLPPCFEGPRKPGPRRVSRTDPAHRG